MVHVPIAGPRRGRHGMNDCERIGIGKRSVPGREIERCRKTEKAALSDGITVIRVRVDVLIGDVDEVALGEIAQKALGVTPAGCDRAVAVRKQVDRMLLRVLHGRTTKEIREVGRVSHLRRRIPM